MDDMNDFAVEKSTDAPVRRRFERALLRGDAAEAAEIAAFAEREHLIKWKDALLDALTLRHLAGQAPFCQLTAVCQAAGVLFDGRQPPVLCFGGARGNTSTAGLNYTAMLLRAWGLPALSLGPDVSAERFLQAVAEHGLRFVLCVAFSNADAEAILQIHRQAAARGMREQFRLLLCGANLTPDALRALPLDDQESRMAGVVREAVRAWKG